MNVKMSSDERLVTLREIAHECFGVETFSLSGQAPDAPVVVSAESIVRALESAYDIGLIAGYRLNRIHAAHSVYERRTHDASAHADVHA
jgi:hypothetical protein